MPDVKLSARLETLLLREIVLEYAHVNRIYFKEALTPPQIALVPSRGHLGRWIRETRTLEMSRPLVLEQPWGVVLEVLKHEMAHQYVHEVLRETTESPHGAAFRATCKRLGIDGAASGLPTAPHGCWRTSGREISSVRVEPCHLPRCDSVCASARAGAISASLKYVALMRRHSRSSSRTSIRSSSTGR